MNKLLGRLRALAVRQISWITLLNGFLLVKIYFQTHEWSYWYLLIVPVWLCLAAYDIKYVWPRELEYWHKKSPVLKEILDNAKNAD